MPPLLAVSLSLTFSFVLLWRESRREQDISKAVWLPTLWMFVLGSRAVSQWFQLSAPTPTADALLEGSPTDRLFFLVLIVLAFITLWRRRPGWGTIFSSNPWLLMFILYCGLSVIWSDFPGVSFKRWVKSVGDPLMALILLTERRPAAAIAAVFKRCAFILIPMSIVFIKYFPDLGRFYEPWSGEAYYTGVTTNKNLLGYLLMVFGLFFLCTVFTREAATDRADRRKELAVAIGLLLMIAWLFDLSDTKTALISLIVAASVALSTSMRVVRRHFTVLFIVTLIVGGMLQLLFNLSDSVLESAGRDSTLTGRTDVWNAVISLAVNPLIGAGYESFWLGDRLKTMWTLFAFQPIQAHNGYLEMYLNLGWVGLFIFTGVLVGGYRRTRGRLAQAAIPGQLTTDELILAKFGMGFMTAYLLYNVTEATFQGLNFLYNIFLMLAVKMSTQPAAPLRAVAGSSLPAGRRPVPVVRPDAHRAARTGVGRLDRVGSHRPIVPPRDARMRQ